MPQHASCRPARAPSPAVPPVRSWLGQCCWQLHRQGSAWHTDPAHAALCQAHVRGAVLPAGRQYSHAQAPAWLLGAAIAGQPGLLCIQQLLVKGLFRSETELVTVEVRPSAQHALRNAVWRAVPCRASSTGLPLL